MVQEVGHDMLLSGRAELERYRRGRQDQANADGDASADDPPRAPDLMLRRVAHAPWFVNHDDPAESWAKFGRTGIPGMRETATREMHIGGRRQMLVWRGDDLMLAFVS
jgi:hypothetical protein